MDVINRVAIKKEARAFIGKDKLWGRLFLAYLPILLLTGFLPQIFSITNKLTKDTILGFISLDLSGFSGLITIFLCPFAVAYIGLYLEFLRHRNPNLQSMYREGADQYGKYLVIHFMAQLFIFLWSLLFVIPGIIKTFEYFFVDYIAHDNPNLTHKQVRELSRRLTDGHKMDLFVFVLSFIPWYLFIGITFGIGTIYVIPYMTTSFAMCYENLKADALYKLKVRPEDFGILPIGQENYNNQNFNFEQTADIPVSNPMEENATNIPVSNPVEENTNSQVQTSYSGNEINDNNTENIENNNIDSNI